MTKMKLIAFLLLCSLCEASFLDGADFCGIQTTASYVRELRAKVPNMTLVETKEIFRMAFEGAPVGTELALKNRIDAYLERAENISSASEYPDARWPNSYLDFERVESPWLVSIQVRDNSNTGTTFRHLCSGIIVSRTWIVAPAHCL